MEGVLVIWFDGAYSDLSIGGLPVAPLSHFDSVGASLSAGLRLGFALGGFARPFTQVRYRISQEGQAKRSTGG